MHWLIGTFWIVGSIPLYAQKLLLEPNVRPVWQIITNPEGSSNQPNRVKRHIYHRYNIKGRNYLPWIPLKLFVHSCYKSTGAYTNHETDINLDGLYSNASSLLTASELANKNFKVTYTFVSKQVKKPSRNSFWKILIVLLLCIIICGCLVSLCAFKIIKQRHKTGRTSTVNRTLLMTTEAGSRALLLFDSDGKTSVVDIAANTYVCSNSCLFIGYLIDSNVTLDTVNINWGLSLKTGPFHIAWEDDGGETLVN